jgi:hypothetical protein
LRGAGEKQRKDGVPTGTKPVGGRRRGKEESREIYLSQALPVGCARIGRKGGRGREKIREESGGDTENFM